MIIKLIIYLILTVSGLMLFKVGGNTNYISLSLSKLDMSISAISILGIVCYGCSFLLWLNIIKSEDISYIFPIANGLVTILTVIGGVLFLQEKVTLMQCIGTIVVIIGVVIINIGK